LKEPFDRSKDQLDYPSHDLRTHSSEKYLESEGN